jgi:hypothetical protein
MKKENNIIRTTNSYYDLSETYYNFCVLEDFEIDTKKIVAIEEFKRTYKTSDKHDREEGAYLFGKDFKKINQFFLKINKKQANLLKSKNEKNSYKKLELIINLSCPYNNIHYYFFTKTELNKLIRYRNKEYDSFYEFFYQITKKENISYIDILNKIQGKSKEEQYKVINQLAAIASDDDLEIITGQYIPVFIEFDYFNIHEYRYNDINKLYSVLKKSKFVKDIFKMDIPRWNNDVYGYKGIGMSADLPSDIFNELILKAKKNVGKNNYWKDEFKSLILDSDFLDIKKYKK